MKSYVSYDPHHWVYSLKSLHIVIWTIVISPSLSQMYSDISNLYSFHISTQKWKLPLKKYLQYYTNIFYVNPFHLQFSLSPIFGNFLNETCIGGLIIVSGYLRIIISTFDFFQAGIIITLSKCKSTFVGLLAPLAVSGTLFHL